MKPAVHTKASTNYNYSSQDIEIVDAARNKEAGYKCLSGTNILVKEDGRPINDKYTIIKMPDVTIDQDIGLMLKANLEDLKSREAQNIFPAKILFPYQRPNPNHWNVGEIIIENEGGGLSVTACAYDPYGYKNPFSENTRTTLEASFSSVFTEKDLIQYNYTDNKPKIGIVQRSNVACGAYTAHALHNLKTKDPSQIWEGLDLGEKDGLRDLNLRLSDEELVKKHNTGQYRNFLSDSGIIKPYSKSSAVVRQEKLIVDNLIDDIKGMKYTLNQLTTIGQIFGTAKDNTARDSTVDTGIAIQILSAKLRQYPELRKKFFKYESSNELEITTGSFEDVSNAFNKAFLSRDASVARAHNSSVSTSPTSNSGTSSYVSDPEKSRKKTTVVSDFTAPEEVVIEPVKQYQVSDSSIEEEITEVRSLGDVESEFSDSNNGFDISSTYTDSVVSEEDEMSDTASQSSIKSDRSNRTDIETDSEYEEEQYNYSKRGDSSFNRMDDQLRSDLEESLKDNIEDEMVSLPDFGSSDTFAKTAQNIRDDARLAQYDDDIKDETRLWVDHEEECKDEVFFNKISGAIAKFAKINIEINKDKDLEYLNEASNSDDKSSYIWNHKSMTTLDRRVLVDFYNENNPDNTIDFMSLFKKTSISNPSLRVEGQGYKFDIEKMDKISEILEFVLPSKSVESAQASPVLSRENSSEIY